MRWFAIVVPVLIFCVIGCGKKGDREASTDGNTFEPIKAAFEKEDIGKPLDWKSLSEANQAFLSALMDRDPVKAKEALAKGAKGDMDCGHGCSSLMLAAATGDEGLVAAVRKAGGKESPDSTPYMEILKFSENAKKPEYQAAVAEIAELAGKPPAPGKRAGTHELELGAQEAETFLEKHHAGLLGKGCYVFLHDQNFGIGDKPDILWVVPTADKFAVMAFTGVDGINYDINNHLVIRWMKRLDRDQPFLMTGCGRDFLSGRFVSKLPDADAMAKRMYAFCPDIVDQGTGSVEDLAKELRKTNEFYFWWD